MKSRFDRSCDFERLRSPFIKHPGCVRWAGLLLMVRVRARCAWLGVAVFVAAMVLVAAKFWIAHNECAFGMDRSKDKDKPIQLASN
jgi:hypothetical protein